MDRSPKPSALPADSAAAEWELILQARGRAVDEFYRKNSPHLLPPEFDPDEWQNPFDRFDISAHPKAERAHRAARDWVYAVSSGQPQGLLLWSSGYGTGKTMLAEAAAECLRVMRNLQGQPQRVSLLTAPEFFQIIKDCYATGAPVRPWFAEWTRGHFILDDWGKQYTTPTGDDWAREQFFQLINTVCQRHGFLLTSNVPPQTIESQMGGAAFSRLLGMCGPRGIVDLNGVPDYRLKRAGF
jgi:DNA replication protein DnaC